MRGFVDLHAHYLPSIDDGVRTFDDGVALLRGLYSAGFDRVVATPHMRPALFDNEAGGLRSAFTAFATATDEIRKLNESSESKVSALPAIELAAEHFLDDTVFARLIRGEGLAYGVGRSVLVEFLPERPPNEWAARFFDLRMKRLRPVVAHPERYEVFWKSPRDAATLFRRAGGVLLLDVAALDGKYGTKAKRTAEVLVDDGAYYAACSDAHRPDDAGVVASSIAKLGERVGERETMRLLRDGPREILAGRICDAFD